MVKKSKNTKFKVGETRIFIKKCEFCNLFYDSKSGSRKICYECNEKLKCKNCNKKLPNFYHDFCSKICSAKWNYENNPKCKEFVLIGIYDPKRISKVSIMAKNKKGKPNLNLRGAKNPNWKGGDLRKQRNIEMGRIEYINWRNSIFKRDNYICQICFKNKIDLNAHHIKEWAKYINLRYNIDNGITLCVNCHKNLHYGKKRKDLYATL